jgi:spore coat protein U-like protein
MNMNLSRIYAKPGRRLLVAFASTAALAMSANVFAAEGTTTMPVSLLIVGGCSISATPMVFPTPVTLAAIATTAQLDVTCSNGIPYEIGLDAGLHSVDVAARDIVDAATSEVIAYSIYLTGAHTTVWGNTLAVDTVAGTSDGYIKQYAAYGYIPVPTVLPTAGTYTDTITATVTF